mmetsp:Transcript_34452/g.33652  ORF Transcript_34452/g.33652 Transcript_34452/m.33652 type:complete len:102 (-) Transcript_34452:643-948(-)
MLERAHYSNPLMQEQIWFHSHILAFEEEQIDINRYKDGLLLMCEFSTEIDYDNFSMELMDSEFFIKVINSAKTKFEQISNSDFLPMFEMTVNNENRFKFYL